MNPDVAGPGVRKVTVLSTGSCPNVATARANLSVALSGLHDVVEVEERSGPYPSPTVLVDERDVLTGEYVGTGSPTVACCRLSVPSVAQLRAALLAAGPAD